MANAGAAGTDDYILTAVTLVIMTVVVTVPLLPWHAFVLGLAVEGVYIFSCWPPGSGNYRPLYRIVRHMTFF